LPQPSLDILGTLAIVVNVEDASQLFAGRPPIGLLESGLWQRGFGNEQALVGTTILVAHISQVQIFVKLRIVGVARLVVDQPEFLITLQFPKTGVLSTCPPFQLQREPVVLDG
jgi:hypothetical protein